MKLAKTSASSFLFVICLLTFTITDFDNVQIPYFKSVRCKHNPKYAYNVTCFAKSWSRNISTGTFVAGVVTPLTSVMVRTFC